MAYGMRVFTSGGITAVDTLITSKRVWSAAITNLNSPTGTSTLSHNVNVGFNLYKDKHSIYAQPMFDSEQWNSSSSDSYNNWTSSDPFGTGGTLWRNVPELPIITYLDNTNYFTIKCYAINTSYYSSPRLFVEIWEDAL